MPTDWEIPGFLVNALNPSAESVRSLLTRAGLGTSWLSWSNGILQLGYPSSLLDYWLGIGTWPATDLDEVMLLADRQDVVPSKALKILQSLRNAVLTKQPQARDWQARLADALTAVRTEAGGGFRRRWGFRFNPYYGYKGDGIHEIDPAGDKLPINSRSVVGFAGGSAAPNAHVVDTSIPGAEAPPANPGVILYFLGSSVTSWAYAEIWEANRGAADDTFLVQLIKNTAVIYEELSGIRGSIPNVSLAIDSNIDGPAWWTLTPGVTAARPTIGNPLGVDLDQVPTSRTDDELQSYRLKVIASPLADSDKILAIQALEAAANFIPLEEQSELQARPDISSARYQALLAIEQALQAVRSSAGIAASVPDSNLATEVANKILASAVDERDSILNTLKSALQLTYWPTTAAQVSTEITSLINTKNTAISQRDARPPIELARYQALLDIEKRINILQGEKNALETEKTIIETDRDGLLQVFDDVRTAIGHSEYIAPALIPRAVADRIVQMTATERAAIFWRLIEILGLPEDSTEDQVFAGVSDAAEAFHAAEGLADEARVALAEKDQRIQELETALNLAQAPTPEIAPRTTGGAGVLALAAGGLWLALQGSQN